jgi:hypothetical protein
LYSNPGPKQWQQRLAAAVAALSPEDFDELRPTYRHRTQAIELYKTTATTRIFST